MAASLREFRIGILGAGLSGLGVANALVRRGLKNVKIFDKSPSQTAASRVNGAMVIPANGVRILDTWNIRSNLTCQELLQIGSQAANGRIIHATDQQSVSEQELAQIRRNKIPNSPPICVGVGNLLQTLENNLESKVLYNHALKKVDLDPEEDWEITLSFANGDEHTVDMLIGADGVDSILRNNFFETHSAPTSMGQWWISGTTELKNWKGEPNVCFECRGTATRIWASRISESTVGWKGTVFEEKYQKPAEDSIAEIAEIFRPAPSDIIDAILSTQPQNLSSGSVRVYKPHPNWNQYGGRLLLTGSAVHGIPDSLMQDTGMLLESAEALAMAFQDSCEKYVDVYVDDDLESVAFGLNAAAEKYEAVRLPRVQKIYLDSKEEQMLLNTSSSIMSGLRATAEWMNRFTTDISIKDVVGYDIFDKFGSTAHRTL